MGGSEKTITFVRLLPRQHRLHVPQKGGSTKESNKDLCPTEHVRGDTHITFVSIRAAHRECVPIQGGRLRRKRCGVPNVYKGKKSAVPEGIDKGTDPLVGGIIVETPPPQLAAIPPAHYQDDPDSFSRYTPRASSPTRGRGGPSLPSETIL